MLIGIDFDNTIASYGDIFYRAAVERELVPAELPRSKTAVRDFLRENGREHDWTELQGLVYGELITQAVPFSGVLPFFAECVRRAIPAAIISHRTQRPHRGPEVNLHAAARRWIAANLPAETRPSQIFLEETRAAKLHRIASIGCTHFIDDLPEFLTAVDFPADIERVQFDPEGRSENCDEYIRAESWDDIRELVFPH